MKNKYAGRIEALRLLMKKNSWDAVVVTGTDPHSSEYPAARWKQVEWLTGFTGEAGDVVVTLDHAGLWTDSRYFIQAVEQLSGTGVELHKTRVPGEVSIPDWLRERSIGDSGISVAIDSLCQNVEAVQSLACRGIRIIDLPDMMSELWSDRPAIPDTSVEIVDVKNTGMSRRSKIAWLRGKMRESGCSAMLLSSLDEIAWVLNVRGRDIDYNPYLISYLLVTMHEVKWFIVKERPAVEIDGVTMLPYDSIKEEIASLRIRGRIFVDCSTLNQDVFNALKTKFGLKRIWAGTSPVILRKSLKNRVEVKGFRKAFVEDGVAMERFLFWLENEISSGRRLTEWEASVKLTSLRAEIDGYRGDSFENISAYGKNAALPHYCTPEEGSSVIEPHGLYLVDSGGHYLFGTTDITRTVPTGPCTKLEKTDYTLVLRGMIDLAMAVFPKGTAGCQIDAFARGAMWRGMRNFGHGTGHGIGHYLGVHEGPQSIRQNFLSQPMLPSMVTSDEPGLYREGMHGIRHENVILCVEKGVNEFGSWLGFETLTCCHIDTSAILTEMMQPDEIKWLNEYNAKVYRTLARRLSPEIAAWLKVKTAPVTL